MREAHSRRTSESEINERTKGMGFVAHTCLNQHTTGLRARVIGGLAACIIMALGVACENKPAETSTVKPDLPSARTGLLRLTSEELSRMQLELVPVQPELDRRIGSGRIPKPKKNRGRGRENQPPGKAKNGFVYYQRISNRG